MKYNNLFKFLEKDSYSENNHSLIIFNNLLFKISTEIILNNSD